ncbi:uncharacterized protein N7496_001198 [Penicillium cataractarum]|uniref:Mediator of RNA polymerase II transcription subunit 9 n=1 Tax=Penicillium cataractarum TaxID=2100454 RepID=A0A9W9VVU0_9EURO|nr:uncharacterized protein N7496_001198 [Penicillium cataractarum]KAJ5390130.1 hypothetical protein N7496_001198 [Penicillium cataractarum]
MASRSPTAATPLPKSSAAPESPKDASDTPDTVPFPPPQTFEIIPPLHGILLRLLSPKPAQAAPTGVSGETAGAPGASVDAQGQHQQAPSSIPGADNNNPATSQAIPEVTLHDSNGVPPLDVKDLPTATSSVRIRIQKARAVVEALPDVDRSVEEQQEEMTELEDRISRLRSVIADFGGRARKPHEGRLEITAS